jgi:hypothetical protein
MMFAVTGRMVLFGSVVLLCFLTITITITIVVFHGRGRLGRAVVVIIIIVMTLTLPFSCQNCWGALLVVCMCNA